MWVFQDWALKVVQYDCILRGCVMVLEIVFVGQCEGFVCLDFENFSFFFSPWPRSS